MTVPSYDKFIEPLLRHLAVNPAGIPVRDVHEACAQAFNLSASDRQELLPSGSQLVYKNRIGWAHDRLKRAGFSRSPRRGYWCITEQGLTFAQAHLEPLSLKEVEQIAVGFNDVRLRPLNSQPLTSKSLKEMPAAGASPVSPDEQLIQAVSELEQSVTAELREVLNSVSPSFFETIVLDLLHRMGYGANRADLQRTGKAGDGGIDGVISLDKLGLEKVYVQAKRWRCVVGRPTVQAFRGALGEKPCKAVFITTSAYTAQAIQYAESLGSLVLIDGMRLAQLMIEHEVGVSTRTIKIPRLDQGYFDEESM